MTFPVVVVKNLRPSFLISPRCEALKVIKYARRSVGDDGPCQCRMRSTVHIDGQYMCRKHAGKLALEILLGRSV